jgi:hypothetical protein
MTSSYFEEDRRSRKLVGRGAQRRWWRGDRPSSVCYDLDMAHRLELAVKGLAFERVATGVFVAIAPGRAIGVLTTPGYDTEAARYVTRLLGIRQVVLGVMLWQARNDRAWLRRVATLNALTEALDAAATLASGGQRRDGRPPAAPAVAALATSAVFLALRASAS